MNIFWLFLYILKGVLFQKQSTDLQTPNLSNLLVKAPRQQTLSEAQTK